jgi:putative ABC transport system permease protein
MFLDLLRDVFRDIRAHWLRVVLTSLGVLWGIMLFVFLTANGDAGRRHFREKIEVIGANTVFTFPGWVIKQGPGNHLPREVHFDRKDPPRLPASAVIAHSSPELWAEWQVVKGGGHIKVVPVYGVGPDSAVIRNFEMNHGRFITAGDVDAHARVLVVGAKVEQRLFGRRSAIGREVWLAGFPFRIVGVAVPRGQQMINMMTPVDEQVLMPITTAQSLITGSDRVGFILYEPRNRSLAQRSMDEVRAILGLHHRFTPGQEEALGFFNVGEIVTLINNMQVGFEIFMTACGLLTLVAGAVGVMNIMLVAVTERTRELGLRMALGATPQVLFFQTLVETVIITVSAGAVGVALAGLLITLFGSLPQADPGAEMVVPKVTFPVGLAVISCVVLTGTGILAGLLPAIRAARLDPAIALREE